MIEKIVFIGVDSHLENYYEAIVCNRGNEEAVLFEHHKIDEKNFDGFVFCNNYYYDELDGREIKVENVCVVADDSANGGFTHVYRVHTYEEGIAKISQLRKQYAGEFYDYTA